MYILLGIKENIRNLTRLSKPFLQGSSKDDLRQAFKTFLTKAQPSVPRSTNNNLLFLSDRKKVELLLDIFEEDSILDDFENVFDPSDTSEQHFSIEKTKEAIDLLKDLDENFHHLFHLVINTIFAAPSKLAGGGSTSAAIGCIWVNARKHWHIQDLLEFIVHETTHNLIFLDELCYGHYSYSEISKKEHYAWSAILNKPRPLDKVFHSIVVSTEVLFFREKCFGHPLNPCLHPPTDIMLSQALHSISYLKQHDHLRKLLTNRANDILDLCEEKIKSLETLRGNLCSQEESRYSQIASG